MSVPGQEDAGAPGNPDPTSVSRETEGGWWACPRCRSLNRPGSARCYSCGTPFATAATDRGAAHTRRIATLGVAALASVALVSGLTWFASRPTATPQPSSAQATDSARPSRAPVKSPSPPPSQQATYGIGQPVAVAGVETHTVLRVEVWPGRDSAPAGERYLAVEVEIQADVGKSPKFDQLDYTVRNQGGAVRNALPVGRIPQLGGGQLAPSTSVTAWVTFQVPDPGPYSLAYAFPLGHDGVVDRTVVRLDPIAPATPEPTSAPQPKATTGPESPPTSANWGYPTALTSTYYSGYGAISPLQTAAVTFVTGSWTQSQVTCDGSSQRRSMAIWVGIEDVAGNDLEQLGTGADCEPGTTRPRYYAWYEMFPSNPVLLSLSVRPGDQFTASVTRHGNTWTLAITNRTTGKKSSTNHVRRTPGTLALWVIEAPSTQVTQLGQHVIPLARYATVTMTSAQAVIGGVRSTVAGAPWAHFRFDMVTSDGAPKAITSKLKSGGTTFTSAWRHQ